MSHSVYITVWPQKVHIFNTTKVWTSPPRVKMLCLHFVRLSLSLSMWLQCTILRLILQSYDHCVFTNTAPQLSKYTVPSHSDLYIIIFFFTVTRYHYVMFHSLCRHTVLQTVNKVLHSALTLWSNLHNIIVPNPTWVLHCKSVCGDQRNCVSLCHTMRNQYIHSVFTYFTHLKYTNMLCGCDVILYK